MVLVVSKRVLGGMIIFHTVDGSEIRLTTWDVKKTVNNMMNYLSTGAGFLPSTVLNQLLSKGNESCGMIQNLEKHLDSKR